MHQQKVEPPKLTPLKGLAAVATIVAAVFADWFAAHALGLWLGPAATAVAFWGIGLVIALFVMRRYVLSYSYILGPGMLRISFAYGRYERVMTDIYLNNILYAGTLEQAKGRFPDARVNSACIKRAPFAPLAVACRDGGKPAIYVIQPDEVIREKIEAARRKK
ncbi:MAG: hypothetical protein E7317_05400 [Clostridiales bacterium]|nr:hypothetical protein [Clostridiales bacterium]